MFLEAIVALQVAIQNIKNIISDPEKNLGRLNREDKVFTFLISTF